jgi:hypothetical protein
VFVTSGARDATSTNIADYNTFVQNAARNSSVLNTALTAAGFNPTSITWTAIGSTSAVNARVNTQTQATDTSRPIYRLDGALVATSYADLWDGSIGVPINLTELDSLRTNPPDCCVWTGTLSSGTSSSELGRNPTTFGRFDRTGGDWVADRFPCDLGAFALPLYGISSVLTVPTPVAVPEPSSLLGFITLGGLMLGGVARKARK